MLSIKDMNGRERKIYDSIYNGWYMGGKYRALLDGHERFFWADSPGILFKDLERWYASHEQGEQVNR